MSLVEEEVVQLQQVRVLEALQPVQVPQHADLVQRLFQVAVPVLDNLWVRRRRSAHLQTQVCGGVAAHVHALHGDAEGGAAQHAQDEVAVGDVVVLLDAPRRVEGVSAHLRRVEDGQEEEVDAAIVGVEDGGNDDLLPHLAHALLHLVRLDVQHLRVRGARGGVGSGGELAVEARGGILLLFLPVFVAGGAALE